MNILVDCRSIQPDTWGGIDTFTNIVIEGLARQGVRIVIDAALSYKPWYENYFSAFPNVRCVSDPVQGFFATCFTGPMPLRVGATLTRQICKLFHFDPLGRRAQWAARQVADVVFYPFHKDTPQHQHIPMVTTVHAVLPEYGLKEMQTVASHIDKAKAIAVSWPHPYKDMAKRFPDIVDHLFMIPFTTRQNVETATKFDLFRLGVSGDYLFYPAVLSKRKNHENLIRAYGIARQQGDQIPPTVCSGGGDTGLREQLERLALQLGVAEKVKFVGYVSREAMAALYTNCLGTVAPTYWEAGMATLQEGGYCGKPAACSDIEPARAHAELLGMEVCFFRPEEPADIAEKLVLFVADIDSFRASAQRAAKLVRRMDDIYLGRCYLEMLEFAAGYSSRPGWAPFSDPRPLISSVDTGMGHPET